MPSVLSSNKPKLKFEFDAIGTHWTITSEQSLADAEPNIIKRACIFEQTYSRFKADSTLRKMTAEASTNRLPNDAKALFDFYEELYEVTDGFVTPLIGKTLEQAGYDATYSLQPSQLTQPPSWHEALTYDFPLLTIKKPIILDFGAAGKGYLVDLIGAFLRKNNILDFCINAGGDILVSGSPQIIGLENPAEVSEAIGNVQVTNGAVCASAGNRRKWAGFHHTINPKTLQSPKAITAIWVRAQSAMQADGLATALYFIDPAVLHQRFEFEYVMIIGEDIFMSPHFGAKFFIP